MLFPCHLSSFELISYLGNLLLGVQSTADYEVSCICRKGRWHEKVESVEGRRPTDLLRVSATLFNRSPGQGEKGSRKCHNQGTETGMTGMTGTELPPVLNLHRGSFSLTTLLGR